MTADKTWNDVQVELDARERAALEAGSTARVAQRKERNQLSPLERIEYLLDAGSFTELNKLAEHQCHEFGMDQKRFPGDGVITGHGTIGGRRVFVCAEDDAVLGGSTGKVHGSKIHYLLRLARQNLPGSPEDRPPRSY